MKLRIPILSLVFASLLLLSSCNSPLLDERFLDSRLANWTIIDDPETVEIPSDWHVEADGWLHQSSNIWGRRGDFLGRWYGTFIVAGEANWADYRMTVKAKPDDDDGFGVVFRFQDAEHFYRLIFINDTLSGGPLTRLDKRDGADYTEIWSVKKGFKLAAETMIEVEVKGDSIRSWVDGQRLFEVKDEAYRRGKIGLFCYAQKQQAFDNVRVTSE
jgi:hypothetical protein